MNYYGRAPKAIRNLSGIELTEVMYYLYLPIKMSDDVSIRLPQNIKQLMPMVDCAENAWRRMFSRMGTDGVYIYISARKGWATPDNPLNRPGWHCDGFGTDDINFIWWRGPGTRFAYGDFNDISPDHNQSLIQFDTMVNQSKIFHESPGVLYMIDPYVVHATPIITQGCWREYVKISFSKHRYNLKNNSHNYLFDYDWKLHDRSEVRNDPARAQADFKKE